MVEIATGELPKQNSALQQEFDSIEAEKDIHDQAYYAAIALHDLFTNKSAAYNKDIESRVYAYRHFRPPEDGRDFLQAGVPRSGKEYYEVGELAYDQRDPITMYDLKDRRIIRVPQCHMLQVPKESNPYLYLTMSTCSAVIGETDTDIFVAHVGLSEREGLQKFIEYMKQQGVDVSRMYAFASLGEIPDVHKGVKTDHFDFSRVDSVDDFSKFGIPEDHIRTFEYFQEPHSIAGVIVTPRYVGSYLCDYSPAEGENSYGEMRNIDVIEL